VHIAFLKTSWDVADSAVHGGLTELGKCGRSGIDSDCENSPAPRVLFDVDDHCLCAAAARKINKQIGLPLSGFCDERTHIPQMANDIS